MHDAGLAPDVIRLSRGHDMNFIVCDFKRYRALPHCDVHALDMLRREYRESQHYCKTHGIKNRIITFQIFKYSQQLELVLIIIKSCSYQSDMIMTRDYPASYWQRKICKCVNMNMKCKHGYEKYSKLCIRVSVSSH